VDEVEEGAAADLVVVGVAGIDRHVDAARVAFPGALGAERIEVEAVAATHLRDEGKLGGEVEHPGVRPLLRGAAVLHEAVEDVAVVGGGTGEDAAAGAEALVDHEVVEDFGPPLLILTFGTRDPIGDTVEHVGEVFVTRLEVLPFGDGDGMGVERVDARVGGSGFVGHGGLLEGGMECEGPLAPLDAVATGSDCGGVAERPGIGRRLEDPRGRCGPA